MLQSELIRLIGISHLLQPPLTWFLASPRGLDLRGEVNARSPLAAGVVHNMAVAAVVLPTALGVLLALYPAATLCSGPARAAGFLVAGFWCWRLYRQLFVLGSAWPSTGPAAGIHRMLLAIFTMQGPGLALLLLLP